MVDQEADLTASLLHRCVLSCRLHSPPSLPATQPSLLHTSFNASSTPKSKSNKRRLFVIAFKMINKKAVRFPCPIWQYNIVCQCIPKPILKWSIQADLFDWPTKVLRSGHEKRKERVKQRIIYKDKQRLLAVSKPFIGCYLNRKKKKRTSIRKLQFQALKERKSNRWLRSNFGTKPKNNVVTFHIIQNKRKVYP